MKIPQTCIRLVASLRAQALPSVLCVVTVMLLAGGCAPVVEPRVLWPIPPDEPKVEFVGIYHSQNDFPKGRIARFFEVLLGEEEPAGFKTPFGVVSDGKGTVWVSDIHDRNIRVYDFNTQQVAFYSDEPIFGQPRGLAIDRDENLYVADSERRKIQVFSRQRQFLRSIGDAATTPKPTYVVVNDRLGRLYVTDAKRHEVVVFDLAGRYLFAFGGLGQEAGQFSFPTGIAINAKDEVYVADYFNARVQGFDADGKFLRAFGERGDQASQFEQPRALAFDSEGNLWVADNRRGSIYTYTPDGTLLLVTGSESRSTHALGFTNPAGMFIDSNDRIYVTDMMNKRFSVWQYLSARHLKENPVTEADIKRLMGIVDPEVKGRQGASKD